MAIALLADDAISQLARAHTSFAMSPSLTHAWMHSLLWVVTNTCVLKRFASSWMACTLCARPLADGVVRQQGDGHHLGVGSEPGVMAIASAWQAS